MRFKWRRREGWGAVEGDASAAAGAGLTASSAAAAAANEKLKAPSLSSLPPPRLAAFAAGGVGMGRKRS